MKKFALNIFLFFLLVSTPACAATDAAVKAEVKAEVEAKAEVKAVDSGNKAVLIIEGLQKRYESINSVKAAFTQEAYNAMLDGTEVQEGTVYFKRPGLMRWDYLTGERIISDGTKIWFYQPDLRQALEMPMPDSAGSVALNFLGGVGKLDDDFDIVIISESENGTSLALTPKEPIPNVEAITLTIDKDFLVRETLIRDLLKNETKVVFNNIETNKEIDPKLFTLDVPEGTAIIHP